MKKFTIITLIAAFAISAAVLAGPGMGRRGGCGFDEPHHFGQRGPGMRGGPGHHQPGPGMLLRFSDELDLTEEQVDRLETLQTQFSKDMIDRRAEAKKARIELRSLMRGDAPESEVEAAIDNVTRLRGENMKTRYRHRQQIESVLTEQQLEQLEEMRREGPRGGDCPKGRHGSFREAPGGGPHYGCRFGSE